VWGGWDYSIHESHQTLRRVAESERDHPVLVDSPTRNRKGRLFIWIQLYLPECELQIHASYVVRLVDSSENTIDTREWYGRIVQVWTLPSSGCFTMTPKVNNLSNLSSTTFCFAGDIGFGRFLKTLAPSISSMVCVSRLVVPDHSSRT